MDTVCTPGGASCTVSHPGSASISFAGQTVVGIEDTVSFSLANNESRPIFLDSFSNSITEAAATPEPSSILLLSFGVGGFGLMRRFRSKA